KENLTKLCSGQDTEYDVITPAIKYNTYCHSGERRNPGVHWMPDQVRHDGCVPLNCRVNIKI
ncbi:MAG: hypothetical protein PVH22_16075, partial [Desulfobacteraceae bacterium]